MKVNLSSLTLSIVLIVSIVLIFPCNTNKDTKTDYNPEPYAGVVQYVNNLEKDINTDYVSAGNQYSVERSEPEPTSEPEPEPEPIPEPSPQPTYSDEDLYLLSNIIAGEANNCDEIMKSYVGSVVLNRVASPEFPSTLKEVIFQKGQYQCVFCGYFKEKPNESTIQIAKQLLTNGPVLPPQVVFQAEFKQGSGVYIHYQNEYFCYE